MGVHGGQHVVFDFAGALELARRLWGLADGVDTFRGKRDTAATTALRHWQGRYVTEFRSSVTAEQGSDTHLSTAMRDDARTLAALWSQAMAEEAKVRYADHVTEKKQHRGFFHRIEDAVFGSDDDYGPEPGPFAVPQPPAFTATGSLPVYD
ncbi:hypothetical protein FF36_01316 [Frankia torreyi]|uniref:Uncharacterized protein n=1 Tax=Frankia torreyi TaxID=1856 RepID=A0A0D8BJE7_9ACTN|nr:MULTISPECIES: hypothetical protein [Frankia]KJE24241.1 hypothetical protein FF36_01316 [Frankia torreyi]